VTAATKAAAASACIVLAFCFLVLGFSSRVLGADAQQTAITIEDPAPYHVHKAGQSFTIIVKAQVRDQKNISYHWQDFTGARLTPDARLAGDGAPRAIVSPSGAPGYYGLVFTAPPDIALPDRVSGEPREYGFVIFAHPAVGESEASPFGTVHADIEDPWLPRGSKTLTWMTVDAEHWHAAMQDRRAHGKTELPIITGPEWAEDDGAPVSSARLEQIGARAGLYFAADPQTRYWEAGLEENLSGTYNKPYYWLNLQRKLRRLHDAAAAAQVNVRLIYQVAGLGLDDVELFLQSPAARETDILSLHPYAWPDFKSPDLWMDTYLAAVRRLEAKYHALLPIWFTEVGAPEFGNYPGGFFGYPKSGKPTGGLSRDQVAAFLVKTHVLALTGSVERIFWYNYADHGPARDEVEQHFGLRDYWGYPKPAYAAYDNLRELLGGLKPAAGEHILQGGARVYKFRGEGRSVVIVWSPPGQKTALSFADLGLAGSSIEAVVDAVGSPLNLSGATLTVTDQPIFIQIRN
jgi:hypothetical protein